MPHILTELMIASVSVRSVIKLEHLDFWTHLLRFPARLEMDTKSHVRFS